MREIKIPSKRDIKEMVEKEVQKQTSYLEKFIENLRKKILKLDEELKCVKRRWKK